MKNLELKDLPNGFEVMEDGEPVGRVIKHSPNSFTWHSFRAKEPLNKGKCETANGALAHLGYKRKKRESA